jgi:uncharacterized protein
MRITVLVLVVACGGREPARVPAAAPVVANAAVTTIAIDAAPPVDVLDDRGWTPLMHAAQMGRLDEIAALLDRGANIDASSDTIYDHATPLLIALEYSQPEAAALLIERGASIADPIGSRALALAARGGDRELVEHLLARGVPASTNALRHAARQGHAEVITMLVAAGAVVNAPDPDDHQYTPLIIACQENEREAVAVLLKAGAKVEATDDDGNTALYWAVFGARPVEIHEYEEIGEPHDTYWVPQRDAPIVQLLVDAKANLDGRNRSGDTALHEAAYLDAAAAARILVAAGASRTVKNHDGKTPYDLARDRKNSVEAIVAPPKRR